jgi:hypothetical protein
MSNLLIAIGGTGQHVALAVSRLVFLGALPDIELAVIDADREGELSLLLKNFNETVRPERTRHPLKNGEMIYPPFRDMHGDPQFHQLFLSENPSQTEQAVFDICVDNASAKLSVRRGMFGRPAVGAAIFTANQETMLKDIFRKAEQATTIFIAGSVVGGTGAGIVHRLVDALPKEAKELYGIIFLQWFRIPAMEGEQIVDDRTQDRNMRYGLDYFFRETRNALEDTLLIGQPSTSQAVTATSKEIKHYFHLIAAYGILKMPETNEKQRARGSISEAAFDDTQPELMYEESWRGQKLKWYVNRANFVKEILDYASSKKFYEEVSSIVAPGLLGRMMRGKPENIGKGLAEAISWYPENKRKDVALIMAETWALLSQQYKFSLDWLDEVLNPLPDNLRDSRSKSVAGADVVPKVKELQSIWADAIPRPETLPEPNELAEIFHRKLADSYVREM